MMLLEQLSIYDHVLTFNGNEVSTGGEAEGARNTYSFCSWQCSVARL